MTREEIGRALTGRRLWASWGGISMDYGRIVWAGPDRPRGEDYTGPNIDTTMVAWHTRNAEDCPTFGAFFPEACERLLAGERISPCEGWEYWLEPEKDEEK